MERDKEKMTKICVGINVCYQVETPDIFLIFTLLLQTQTKLIKEESCNLQGDAVIFKE